MAGRLLVAEGEDALYVAFMGTKQRRDVLTNADARQVPLWPPSNASSAQVAPNRPAHSLNEAARCDCMVSLFLACLPKQHRFMQMFCFLQHVSQARPNAVHNAATPTSTLSACPLRPLCATPTYPDTQDAPAAHRGFLARARAVDTRALLREAERHGRRLVFCGTAPARNPH